MTPTELAAHAEALAAKATKGPWSSPWQAEAGSEAETEICAANGETVVGLLWYDGPHLAVLEDDAAFIAASRDLVPALAAVLREACELLDHCVKDHRVSAASMHGGWCEVCGRGSPIAHPFVHRPDCWVGKVEAFLARNMEVPHAE